MYKFIIFILGISICFSLMKCQNGDRRVAMQQEPVQVPIAKILDTLESYRGIKILDEGPAGSKHTNSTRGVFGCTKFRITIFNDTIVPIDLEIKFPPKQVPSLPDSLIKVQYWVLPDALTPEIPIRGFNFGITGLEEHFNSDFTDSGIVKITIQPKEYHTFYLAGIGEGPFERGSSYSKLFINGQDIDVPYIQDKSVKKENSNGSLELVFGIGHTPHNLYTLIPCGQINFLK
ncbi:MAG: hypothetical protein NXI23_08640 [Bacteroidetes bacterium]|jgi:hypothetical protein|nr:hypothetical protein [Bacteroidota bacterium]MDF1866854.1 hypothetical protein [Saprospiraceae bacterium]